MTKDAELHIAKCDYASLLRVDHKKWQWRTPRLPTPNPLVNLDYLTIEVTDGGKDVHVLIITDHLMRYTQSLVTSSQTVKCTVQGLQDQFVVYYGLPESIVSD